MHRDENIRKIVRVFILAFLGSEMHSVWKQANTHEDVKSRMNFLANDAAILEDSKHQVSIRLTTNDKTYGDGHICSGAIIAPSVVLTAARCIYNYQLKSKRHPSEFRIVLGALDRYQRKEYTLIYGVTHAFYPHSFEPTTLRDDIALLLLARDIPENHLAVQPIPLITRSKSDQLNGTSNYILTGWGKIKDLTSNVLLTANVTQLSKYACARAYDEKLTTGKICASFLQSSMEYCVHDDIGAPLTFNNQLVGISAGFSSCLNKNCSAVYTDIVHHTKWIKDIIGSGTNQNSSVWGSLGFLTFTVLTLKFANFRKL